MCEFQSITPEELLRDRLIFGIRDDKVREKLFRESNLTLVKTDKLCHTAESMVAQMKVVRSGDTTSTTMSAVTWNNNPNKETSSKPTRDCWNCGQRHQFTKEHYVQRLGRCVAMWQA